MGTDIITILKIIDLIVFFYALFTVAYLLIFSLASLIGKSSEFPLSDKKKNIIVLIPAYREDNVIFDSVSSVLKQNYPSAMYKVLVISDFMGKDTNHRLIQMGTEVLVLDTPSGSKGNAMISAVEYIKSGGGDYEIAVVLDADNIVGEGFLNEINDAFSRGVRALQCHRTAKNLSSDIAVLDSVSEEINNSIFRKGQSNLGFSPALAGSGMAFDWNWFCSHIPYLQTAGEDKEIELMLLKDRIPVSYLDNTFVSDYKTEKASTFYNQRRRWIAAQFGALKSGIRELPRAIGQGNRDYVNRILQWFILPRVILLGLTGLAAVILLIASFEDSVKWWILLFLLLTSLFISVPAFLWNKRTFNAFKKLPLIFLMMVANLFRIRGVNKKYIHTHKG